MIEANNHSRDYFPSVDQKKNVDQMQSKGHSPMSIVKKFLLVLLYIKIKFIKGIFVVFVSFQFNKDELFFVSLQPRNVWETAHVPPLRTKNQIFSQRKQNESVERIFGFMKYFFVAFRGTQRTNILYNINKTKGRGIRRKCFHSYS